MAGLLGGASKYLGRVLSTVEEQAWLEVVVESGLFEHPSHVLFGFLAYIRYDSQPDAVVAQLLEHIRNLRVNVQPLESVGRPRRKAGGPESVSNVKESRGCGLIIHSQSVPGCFSPCSNGSLSAVGSGFPDAIGMATTSASMTLGAITKIRCTSSPLFTHVEPCWSLFQSTDLF